MHRQHMHSSDSSFLTSDFGYHPSANNQGVDLHSLNSCPTHWDDWLECFVLTVVSEVFDFWCWVRELEHWFSYFLEDVGKDGSAGDW